MVSLLLLPLLWGVSLQDNSGFELRVQKSVTVQEGLCVLVNCSFSHPWNVLYPRAELYVYWYRTGSYAISPNLVATNHPNGEVSSEFVDRFRLLRDPMTNDCSLSLRDARRSDTGKYFFRVEKGYFENHYYMDDTLNLEVTELTEKPDIHGLEGLESGRPARLTCSLPGYCKREGLGFSWLGAALDSLKPQSLRYSSILTLTPKPSDHGTELTCQVMHQRNWVTRETTIKLNVSYAPQNLTISIFFRNVTELRYVGNAGNGSSLSVLEGDTLRLVCVADGNPPATLSWAQRGGTSSPYQPSSPGILELPRVESGHEGEFTCRAQNPGGSLHVSLHLSVESPPQLLGPSCSWEDEGLHCSCSSRAWSAPSLRWRLGEQLLEENLSSTSFTITSSSAGPWANSSLSLRGGLGSSLRLSCEAQNVHGATSAAVLLPPGKSGSLAGVVPGALGGAGAMALLSLCLCLIFFCMVPSTSLVRTSP
ncbi:sialic acid-binding Ig-like lectin 5 isoform X2 [Rousettus aegyptiacus]|uniref:sialic acid-binding Ig-like lectin 5 isoform X2 n=1 Tax=Rousettus aegyptiacus TaxID=9407 RepID=UPI00168CB40B|nr:sialic acid-binding Ig-like lectin 5 isoform X2 [Rousettus aegyptiacus]